MRGQEGAWRGEGWEARQAPARGPSTGLSTHTAPGPCPDSSEPSQTPAMGLSPQPQPSLCCHPPALPREQHPDLHPSLDGGRDCKCVWELVCDLSGGPRPREGNLVSTRPHTPISEQHCPVLGGGPLMEGRSRAPQCWWHASPPAIPPNTSSPCLRQGIWSDL